LTSTLKEVPSDEEFETSGVWRVSFAGSGTGKSSPYQTTTA